MESVDLQCLRSILLPEVYSSRLATSITTNCSLARYTQVYNITPNASGNCGIVVVPDNVAQILPSASTLVPAPDTALVYVLNGAAFNAATGFSDTAGFYTSDLASSSYCSQY